MAISSPSLDLSRVNAASARGFEITCPTVPDQNYCFEEMFFAELDEKYFIDDKYFWSMAHRGWRRPTSVTRSDSNKSSTGIGLPSYA